MSRKKRQRDYLIQYSGLKVGFHQFDFEVNSSFFSYFEGSEIENASLLVHVEMDRREYMMDIIIKFSGSMKTLCDRCGDDVTLPLKGEDRLIVKFGEEDFENTDDILVLPYSEYELDIAPYIYEFVSLRIPQKKIHLKGECNKERIEKLEQLRIKENTTDLRWEALKKLK